MKCGSQMAVAVVGGYLLGRSHKTRLAALLALLAAAGGECPVDARELLRRTPLGAPLDKLTADIRTHGISVAKNAASSRIDSFSEKLQQRAASMRGPDVTKGGQREEAEEPLEEPAPGERARREPPRRERAHQQASDTYDDYEDDIGQYESAEPEPERDVR